MNLLDLDCEKAKKFFLNTSSYCTLELPKYVNFQELLESISDEMQGKSYIEIKKTNPDGYDDINYILFNNKDGGYDWRPFQLINPVLYVSLVNIITKVENWELIKKRFKEIDDISVVQCESIPIIEDQCTEVLTKKSTQILNWWDKIEQGSIKLSLEYNYIFKTDIVNCYSEIYTHSIAWAIHKKEQAKQKRSDKKLIGNIIDKHIQAMSYGQTNGIPQGSVLMDFIAEMVLKYADELISEEIQKLKIDKKQFKILRYRDDYRIFINEVSIGREIMKIITQVLLDLGLKLNINKTEYSDNIIVSSIKQDKLDFLEQRKEVNLQKRLILLYKFSLKYSNSGSVLKELTQIRQKLEKKTFMFSEGVEVLISIITEIIYRNPRTYVEGSAILSYLFPVLSDIDERKNVIERVYNKLKKVLNSNYFEIWFQRATLKEDLHIEYSEKICKLVNKESVNLWNIDWISSVEIKEIFKKIKLVNQNEKLEMPQRIENSEIKIFDEYGKL